jgi:hypothetical protein
MIDGVKVSVDLTHPLPDGFQLDQVLTGDKIRAVLEPMGLQSLLDAAQTEVAKMEALPAEHARIVFRTFFDEEKHFTLASLARRGVPKHYLFVFEHRGVNLQHVEPHLIIQEAISSMLQQAEDRTGNGHNHRSNAAANSHTKPPGGPPGASDGQEAGRN